jgi:hypothetical protein
MGRPAIVAGLRRGQLQVVKKERLPKKLNRGLNEAAAGADGKVA